MPNMQKHSNSFKELVKGRWREFCREPSALFFVVFMPILWMTILGFAFSRPVFERYGVGWIEGSERSSQLAMSIHASLVQDSHVKLLAADATILERALKRGEIQLIARIADDRLRYDFDPANREALQARRFIDDVIQSAGGRIDPVKAADHAMTVPGTRYVDFLVPGLIALSIMTSSLFGTGMTIVSNRRENLLKRYLATPMRPFEYIASHIVGRGFVLAVELATILLSAMLIFRFQVAGSVLTLILFAALGAAAFTAFAIMCGSRTANMATMNGMTNLVSLPMMIVSGVWFSRSNFPDWMATTAKALPLTALVDGLRRIALEGAGLAELAPEAAILGAYLVVSAITARLLFKWY